MQSYFQVQSSDLKDEDGGPAEDEDRDHHHQHRHDGLHVSLGPVIPDVSQPRHVSASAGAT